MFDVAIDTLQFASGIEVCMGMGIPIPMGFL